ncbi:MAG: lipid II flippase MurJ [Eubacteriales bacterium]|nr:lipid II flippase MurJ [Eubacteriales bacterium]
MKIGMIAAVNMILAFAALARDMLFAVALGTSAAADAFILAFSVPDIIGNNILAVAAGMASIPLLTEILMKRGTNEFARAAKILITSVMTVSLLIFVSGLIFRHNIIGFAGQGMDQATISLSVKLLGILMPAMLFFPLYSLGGAILNIRNRFLPVSFSPVVFNLLFLAGIFAAMIFVSDPGSMIVYIAVSVTAGTAMMALIVWGGILKYGAIAVSDVGKESTGVKWNEILRRYAGALLPYIIVYIASQGVLIAERILAARLGTGTISGLNYAYRMASLPTWIFIAAIGVVALPSLSRISCRETTAEHERSMMIILSRTIMITVPFAVFIFFMREPLVKLLLGRGAFDADSIRITSGILAGYSLSIIGQGVIFICLRFFLSLRYVLLPAVAIMISSAINISADVILIRTFGYKGLGIGAAIGAFLGGTMLLIILDRKTGNMLKRSILSLGKIVISGLVIVFPAYGALLIWERTISKQTTMFELIFLCVVFLILISIYYAALRLFRANIPDLLKVVTKYTGKRREQ